MTMNATEMWAFGVLLLLLAAGWIWLRRRQNRDKLDRERKLACKELILDHRAPLARRKADFEMLVDLVRMGITAEQLAKVIELLITRPVEYSIDEERRPEDREIDLEFEGEPEPAKLGRKEERQPEGEPVEEAARDEAMEITERMSPEKERVWFRMAHNRFRRAMAEKNITERQARFRLLARMVELGKKAVQEDTNKPVKRKEYELELWDRFYENEYLELHQD